MVSAAEPPLLESAFTVQTCCINPVNIAIDYSVFSIYDSGQNKWHSKLIVGNPAGIINRREDLEVCLL
jgi:hypothetical protein